MQENLQLTDAVWRMELSGNTEAVTAPGQFVNLALPGFYLRRPISVCDWTAGSLTLIYKVVGQGTAYMSSLGAGTALDVLTGLGNGFDCARAGERPLLVGGGVGVPPLYGLAKRLCSAGVRPVAILGFNTAKEAFYLGEFRALGIQVIPAAADGTLADQGGIKGFVTDAIPAAGRYTHYYACGPKAMLKAVAAAAKTSGQLSFEERMGCGFGACMGCSCQTKNGNKRLCKEGPVLKAEEVIW